MKQRLTQRHLLGGIAFVLVFAAWVGCNALRGESKEPQQTAVVQASPSAPALQLTRPVLPDHTRVEETPTTVSTVEPLDLCAGCCIKSDVGMVLGKGSVQDLAYSVDGKWLAVASTLGVRLYDGHGSQETKILAEGISVSRIAFSPDGELLASGLAHGDVCLWQVADGSPIAVLHANYWQEITRLSFSSDGTALLAGYRDGDVQGWQLSDGTPIRSLEKLGTATDASFSLDGRQVAGGFDRYVRLWSVLDGTLLKTFESPEGQVQDSALSPDGTMLAFAAGEKAVFVWQVTDGTLLNRFETDSYGAVRDLSFSSDGEFLVAGMEGDINKGVCDTVLVWRMADGQLVRQFVAPNEYGMVRVALSPNGEWLAASTFRAAHIWHVQDNALRETLEGYGNIYSVAFSRDGKFLASGSCDGIVHLWHIADGTIASTIRDPSKLLHAIPACPVVFSPDGKLLASPSKEGDVDLWQVPDGTVYGTLKSEDQDWIRSLSYSADGRYLAASTWGGAVLLWQTTDGVVSVLKGPTCEDIDQVAFSPDDSVLVAGTLQGTVYSWQTTDGSLLNQWQTSSDSETGVADLAFSPNGTFLATTRVDGIQLWNMAGELTDQIGTRGTLQSIAISPDGMLIAGASSGGAVQLWRLDDKSLVYRRRGECGSVTSIAFSENGEWLAIGTSESAILVWPTTP